MKQIIFLVAVFFSYQSLFAQKVLNSGVATYSIDISSSKGNPSVLSGSTFVLSLTPTLSRTDVKSNLGAESAVYDSKAGSGFILKSYSGQNLMITANRSNWADKNKWNDELSFTTEEGTTKIAGYECKKATATGTDGKTVIVYYTPSITVTNKSYNGIFKSLPGLPVQYQVNNGNLTFTYLLKTVSYEAVLPSVFDAPKSGYRVMTYDENQQMKVRD